MIEKLGPETSVEIERLGGKGCGLVRLLAAGFPVPEVWCVPADHCGERSALQHDVESLVAGSGGAAFAVRSSATAEDLEDASFAGVYATVLGVLGTSEILEGIAKCRDSLQSEHARAYREARGIDHDVRMAVLVQRLLDPDVAGVMLTSNPQRAFANEWVIDAAYGLGEGVVSGRVDPDHLVVDRASGEIREERIGAKTIFLHPESRATLVERSVEPADRERLCLSPGQLRELAAMARRIEEKLGAGMDLEWAFEGEDLYLLQARPIVGLPSRTPEDIWSRKFGDEYMADYTTPSSYSFLVRWIREYSFTQTARELGRKDLLEMEPLCRHKGYVYLSGRYTVANLRSLPVDSREGALRGWFPPSIVARAAAEPFSVLELIKNLMRPFRDPRGSMKKNLEALDRHAERVTDELASDFDADLTALSDTELRELLDQLDEIGLDHFRVIRWGMGTYAPLLHGLLENSLRDWIGEEADDLYQRLVSGLPGTRTAEINRALWRLGDVARKEPKLRRAILDDLALEDIRAQYPDSEFLTSFDDFIAVYGHRAATRELCEPRWRETPELILALVRPQIASEVPPQSPEELERASIGRRLEAAAETEARLGSGPLGMIRRGFFRWLCAKTQAFTVYRENQRYYLDMILTSLRNLILEFGRRFEAAGVLADPWDAFLLEADELKAYFETRTPSTSLRATIELRRKHYHRWKDRLPSTYLYDDVETEGEVLEGDPVPGARVVDPNHGLGAARGVTTGRLRVLKEIRQLDQVQGGEILVAENIDPGWTSVFPLLGGLITETGGVLSHGALLAREYGIPAVMGVSDATKRFETGMRVTLDGSTGRVEILDGDSE